MASIADKLRDLIDTRENIKSAIEAKGVEVGSVPFREYPDKIAEIGSGGGKVVDEMADVLFIDFDGTPLYGFTKDEAMAMASLPEPPDHSGDMVPLTFDGWNWSLEDLKEQISEVGECIVGALYYPTDGFTHFIVEQMDDGAYSRRSRLVLQNATTIDWGDGTVERHLGGNAWHTYDNKGIYDVKVSGNTFLSLNNSDASMYFSSYNNVTDVRVGKNITEIRGSAFEYTYRIRTISLHGGVTSIGAKAFSRCSSLKSLVIPNGVTSLGERILEFCYGYKAMSVPKTLNVLPNYTFQYGYVRRRAIIPFGCTSIGASAYGDCYSLSSIIIPKNVTSVGSSAFRNTVSVGMIRFMSQTPPTVSSSDSFISYNLKKIIVPKGCLSVYQSTTNLSSFASIMEEAES